MNQPPPPKRWSRTAAQSVVSLLSLAIFAACQTQPNERGGEVDPASLRTATLSVDKPMLLPAPVIVDDPGNACPECLESAAMTYDPDSQSIQVQLLASIVLEVRWLTAVVPAEQGVDGSSHFALPVPEDLLDKASSIPTRIKMTAFGGPADTPFRLDIFGCLAPQGESVVALNPDECSQAIATRPEVSSLAKKASEELAAKKKLALVELKFVGMDDEPDVYGVEEGGSSGGEE